MIPHVILGTVMGVVLSQVTVLGIWAALGRAAPMLRAVVTVTGSSVLALLLCLGIGEMEVEWFILVWLLALVTTTAFLVLRWCGFHLASTGKRSNIPTEELRFTLSQMFTLMTVITVLAAVGRALRPRMAALGAVFFGLAIACGLALLTLASVWATLGTAAGPRRLVALGLLAIAEAVLVFYVMEATEADPGLAWAIVFSIYVGCTTATLLAARALGLRVSRTSS